MILTTTTQAWPCDGHAHLLFRLVGVPITEHILLPLNVDLLQVRVSKYNIIDTLIGDKL
jgi:hypothetical protein